MIFAYGSNWGYMKQPLHPPLPSSLCINMESDAGILPQKKKKRKENLMKETNIYLESYYLIRSIL